MLLDVGTYRARAVNAWFGYTSVKGTEMVTVTFEIIEGDWQGQTIDWQGYFTEKTYQRTIAALRTMGWQGSDLRDLSGIDANDVAIVVGHEEYNGNLRARVQWVNPVEGGGKIGMQGAMDEAQLADFAERMKGAIMLADQDAGRVPKASAARQAPPRGAAPAKAAPRGQARPTAKPAPEPQDDEIPW